MPRKAPLTKKVKLFFFSDGAMSTIAYNADNPVEVEELANRVKGCPGSYSRQVIVKLRQPKHMNDCVNEKK